MPKIPTYLPETRAAVANLPAIPSYSSVGGAALAQGLSTVGQASSSLSITLKDIARRVEDQKADIEITEVSSIYNSKVRLLKEELLSNPDIEEPTKEFIAREEALRLEAVSGLTMPGTQQAFTKFRAKHMPDAVADMAIGEIKLATQKAGAGVKRSIGLRTNDAAQATTIEERNAIDQEVEDLLARSVGRKFLTADAAETILKTHNERVDMAWATRNSTLDPLGTAEDLRAGRYKGIPPDRAERLANVYIERAERDQKEQIRKSEHEQTKFNRWFEDQKQIKQTELTIAAGNGTLSLEKLQQDSLDWGIHAESYRAIVAVMNKPDKKEISDPDTLTAVSIDSNSGKPKITLAALASMRESGLLNQTDFDRESQKRLALQREDASIARQQELDARRTAADIRRDTALEKANSNYDYTRAKESLQAQLGIPTMWEKLDPVTKKLWAAALAELNARASSVSGQERATIVVPEIVKRFSSEMDQSSRLSLQQLTSVMRFKTKEELDRNKSRISVAEYNLAAEQLIEKYNLEKGISDRAASKAAEQPKPGGISEWIPSFLKSKPTENQPGAPNRRPQ